MKIQRILHQFLLKVNLRLVQIINFAGSKWTILEPSTGYLLKNDLMGPVAFDKDNSSARFAISRTENIGHLLNNTFYNTFSNPDKTLIQRKIWNTGDVNSEQTRTVEADIGLLKYTDWYKYSTFGNPANGFLTSPNNKMWLITPQNDSGITVETNGTMTFTNRTTMSYYKPALYINPETTLSNGTTVLNAIPTVTLNTTNNRTLYESDVINITGTATDMDSGNIVNVKYQIDGGITRAVMTQISAGLPIPFSKSLTLKGGKLYDGTTDITGALAEGTAHSLKVWSEDDYGRSIEETRIFYVVVNRAPVIVTEAIPVSTDQIDSDLITIRGTVTDADGNNISLKYRIGSESFIDIYSGVGGPFSFNVKLSQLQTGKNTITIQSMDTYGSTSTKTLYVTKTANTTPLKTAVSRYVLTPPNGTAKGVVLWVNREVGDLAVNVEISMTTAGEAESFVPMNKAATVFIAAGVEEDQYEYEAPSAKDKIG